MGPDEKRPLIFVEDGQSGDDDAFMATNSEMDPLTMDMSNDGKATSKIRVSILGLGGFWD
jgi:hypothetical protein